MRAIADLLPQTTTATVLEQRIPSWYQTALEGIFGRAQSTADIPYQASPVPRVAGFTPDQNASFNTVRNGIGSWGRNLDNANIEAFDAGTYDVGAAATPYYQQAAEGFPTNVSRYMSPYISGVTDEIARLGTENLSENLLPAVNDQFVGAGQYGSGRNEEFVNRAVRDTGREILGQQSQALQAGYGQAGQLYGQDVNALLGAGQGIAQATNQDASNARSQAELYANLGGTQQGLNLKDAAALQSVGDQQQALGQRSLDTAYGDFLEQRDYPKTQTSYLSSIIRGYNPPTSTSSTQTGTANANQLAPSTLSQLGGLAAGATGLAGAFGLFGKTGGRVPQGLTPRRFASGGIVDAAQRSRGVPRPGQMRQNVRRLPPGIGMIGRA